MTNETNIQITKDTLAVSQRLISEIEQAMGVLSSVLKHESTLKEGLSLEVARTLLVS
jgi:hypothetical protein